MPRVYMIGGPNGVGKTTAAYGLLPDLLHCEQYVNADAIAAGLSPFEPESTAILAGRLMLERVKFLSRRKVDFAFETTMASRSFAPLLRSWRRQAYEVVLLFLWVQSPELALARIAARVREGGHALPEVVVRRRYDRSAFNFVQIYIPLADDWSCYDNSGKGPIFVAGQESGKDIVVREPKVWEAILRQWTPK